MSDEAAVAPAENNVTKSTEKRNRVTTVSRATAEGEALLKEMGFEDKETPGRRRTRAAIRGDVYTPPTKKERKSPAPGTGRRGRPPKKTEEKKEEEPVAEEEEEEEEEEEKKKKEEKKEEVVKDKKKKKKEKEEEEKKEEETKEDEEGSGEEEEAKAE